MPQPGKYKVAASCATTHPASQFVVEAAGAKLEGNLSSTGAWEKSVEVDLGTIDFKQPGDHTLKIAPRDAQSWKPVNLRWVRLQKE